LTVAPGQPRQLERLRWKCRRGLLELDLILGAFLEQGYDALASPEQEAFDRLLSLPDQQLLACLQGQERPDPELERIVRKIRQ